MDLRPNTELSSVEKQNKLLLKRLLRDQHLLYKYGTRYQQALRRSDIPYAIQTIHIIHQLEERIRKECNNSNDSNNYHLYDNTLVMRTTTKTTKTTTRMIVAISTAMNVTVRTILSQQRQQQQKQQQRYNNRYGIQMSSKIPSLHKIIYCHLMQYFRLLLLPQLI